jgi:hypothetical protein
MTELGVAGDDARAKGQQPVDSWPGSLADTQVQVEPP